MHIAKIRQGYLMFTSAMAILLFTGCGSSEPNPLPSRPLAASEDTNIADADTATKAKKKATVDSVPVQPVEAPSPNTTALAPTQLAAPASDTTTAGGAGSLLGGITGGNPLGGGSLLGGLGGLGGLTDTASSLLNGVTGLLGGGGGLLGGLGGIGNLGAQTGGLTGQPAANQ